MSINNFYKARPNVFLLRLENLQLITRYIMWNDKQTDNRRSSYEKKRKFLVINSLVESKIMKDSVYIVLCKHPFYGFYAMTIA